MKTKLIVAAALLLTPYLPAKECRVERAVETKEEKRDINTQVPKELKGARIIVRTADGKEREMSIEQFKVVPRKQQFVVSKVTEVEKLVCEAPKAELPKNRVMILGGKGPSGDLSLSKKPTMAEVKTEPELVVGAGYQRRVYEALSVGGQLQTNGTALFSVGLDF